MPWSWRKVAAHLAAAWNPAATARALLPRAARGAGGGRRFAPLDGARALALIWVLAYHSVGLSNMRGLTEIDPETDPCAVDVALLGQRWANNWATQLWQNGNMGERRRCRMV